MVGRGKAITGVRVPQQISRSAALVVAWSARVRCVAGAAVSGGRGSSSRRPGVLASTRRRAEEEIGVREGKKRALRGFAALRSTACDGRFERRGQKREARHMQRLCARGRWQRSANSGRWRVASGSQCDRGTPDARGRNPQQRSVTSGGAGELPRGGDVGNCCTFVVSHCPSAVANN